MEGTTSIFKLTLFDQSVNVLVMTFKRALWESDKSCQIGFHKTAIFHISPLCVILQHSILYTLLVLVVLLVLNFHPILYIGRNMGIYGYYIINAYSLYICKV